jgi:hypothetical protein
MPRTLKNTRIKGLPPKMQLRNRDAITGSYPSHPRVASDNRTGVFNTFYNDTKTVLFQSVERVPDTYETTGPAFDPSAPSGTYDNYAIGDGTFCWWPLEKFDGSTFVLDSSGNGNDGEVFVPGKWTVANIIPPYYWAGTSGPIDEFSVKVNGLANSDAAIGVDIGNLDLVVAGKTQFTLSVHFKLTSFRNVFNPLIWKGIKASSFSDFELHVINDGSIEFGVFESASGKHRIYATAAGLVSAGTWYHIAVTFHSGNGLVLYLNGTAIATTITVDTGWPDFTLGNGQLYMGGEYDLDYIAGSRTSDCTFDNFFVAAGIATATEVSYLYLGGPTPGTMTTTITGSGLSLPAGLPTTNPAFLTVDATGSTVLNREMRSDIVVTGVVRKGVGDKFVTFTPGQNFQPFRDSGNPAVDALSVFSGSTENPFYATGSKVADVGEGFDQPLWSKTKIEIDLTPSVSHSFSMRNTTGVNQNYPMAYWNKDRRVWEGIGNGKEFTNYASGTLTSLRQLFEEQCIGFGACLNNGGVGLNTAGAGAKVSNFGFPYHAKYHATSSNTISISDYITEPFLVEKIVLEYSASMVMHSTSYAGSPPYTGLYSITTFFILNQRRPFGYMNDNVQRIQYRVSGGAESNMITGVNLPTTYNGIYVDTIRDLVTYAQVLNSNTTDNGINTYLGPRELSLYYPDSRRTTSVGWSGRLTLSGTVKNALPADFLTLGSWGSNDPNPVFAFVNANSTRSGLFVPSGRDWNAPLVKGEVSQSAVQSLTTPVVNLTKYSKVNPYLLLPGDKLVFGWQLPVPDTMNNPFGVHTINGPGPSLDFAAVPSKITLYGSLVREQREFHDTLNQSLTSVSIHEAIE